MNKTEQAAFEAFHIARAHAVRLVGTIDSGTEEEMMAQADRTLKAIAAFVALPKPEQKAA